ATFARGGAIALISAIQFPREGEWVRRSDLAAPRALVRRLEGETARPVALALLAKLERVRLVPDWNNPELFELTKAVFARLGRAGAGKLAADLVAQMEKTTDRGWLATLGVLVWLLGRDLDPKDAAGLAEKVGDRLLAALKASGPPK